MESLSDYIIHLKKNIQNILNNVDNNVQLDSLIGELKFYTQKLTKDCIFSSTKNIDILPDYLFFDNNVQKIYGICPFINKSNDEKHKWLLSQKDKGVLFFIRKDYYLNNSTVSKLASEIDNIEYTFENLHNVLMSKEDQHTLTLCINIFLNYFKALCKSKRLKCRYNLAIEKINVVIKNTSLPLYNYISTKIDKQLLVDNAMNCSCNNIQYNELLLKYSNVKKEHKRLENNIKNNIDYMKKLEELYTFGEN